MLAASASVAVPPYQDTSCISKQRPAGVCGLGFFWGGGADFLAALVPFQAGGTVG